MALFRKKRGDDRRQTGERRWCSERRIWVEEDDPAYDVERSGVDRRSGNQRRSGEDRRKKD